VLPLRPPRSTKRPRANADETNNRRWGGWDSNPRPADYEKPALMPRCLQLHEQHGPGHLRHSSHQHPPLPRSTNRSTATLNTTANPATERDHGGRRTARLTYPAGPPPACRSPTGGAAVHSRARQRELAPRPSAPCRRCLMPALRAAAYLANLTARSAQGPGDNLACPETAAYEDLTCPRLEHSGE